MRGERDKVPPADTDARVAISRRGAATQRLLDTREGQQRLGRSEIGRLSAKPSQAQAVRERENIYQQARRQHSAADDVINTLFKGAGYPAARAAWMLHPATFAMDAPGMIRDDPKVGIPLAVLGMGLGPIRGGRALGKLARAAKKGEKAKDAAKVAGQLPPVPKGHVRLYRGEYQLAKGAEPGEHAGRWFTPDKAYAQRYAGTPSAAGRLLYVDVPEDAARRYVVSALDERPELDVLIREGTEIVLPPKLAAAAKVADELPEGADEVIDALPGAKRARAKQERLYSAERAKRAARAEEALQIEGDEGWRRALHALKGELPKVELGPLQFNPETANTLFRHIRQHPKLRPFEKVRTERALRGMMEKRTPQHSEMLLLERVFGRDETVDLVKAIPASQKWKDGVLNLLNVPRSLKASYDLSAPFRQGLVLGARHPAIFARSWGPMLRAAKSERFYNQLMDDIASRPTFKLMEDAKLSLTDLESMSLREEQFMSQAAERIPGIGRGVRASGRGYTAFLNKFRADAFDYYLEVAESHGKVLSPDELKGIASWINVATGRGAKPGGFIANHAPFMNATFFSPQLIASRVKLLRPDWYATLPPVARREALRGMANLAGAASLTLWLAKQAGADVELDPRSADFGKIKVGDTRVDILGGLGQYIVLGARIAKGEKMSSSTGELIPLAGGFAGASRFQLGIQFLENKLAPVPAYGVGWSQNENFAGDPFNPVKEAGRLLLPLGVESTWDTYQQAGARTAGLGFGLNAVGFGVQSYPPYVPERESRRGVKPGSGGRASNKPGSGRSVSRKPGS